MEKEKDFIDAEIINDNSKKKDYSQKNKSNQINSQIKKIKKILLFKGTVALIIFILFFVLILGSIIALFFWLLPIIFALILTILIIWIIFKITLKIYLFLKKGF